MENKQIRVMHIVGAMNMGGTETMLMNIYRNIDKSKVQFDFISYSDEEGYYDEEIISLGGKIIKINNRNSINKLYEIIKKNGPYDVVHAHTLFNCGIAMTAAKKCGVKIRIAHSHTNLDSSSNIVKKIYMKIMRSLININATNLLACSEAAGKYLFGNKILSNKKYSYFPNLIDYTNFLDVRNDSVNKLKNELDINSKLVIGNIGRFVDSKNQKFLIEIIKSIKDRGIDATLLLAGEGPTKSYIEELAIEKGVYDNTKFLGIRKDIHTVLNSMDVFVFPSIYEGLGLVMLEAQASSIPCVVSTAIQPEADLGLGLVNKLSLDDSIDKWVDTIINVYDKSVISEERIIQGFESTGYSIDIGIDKLMKIYGI